MKGYLLVLIVSFFSVEVYGQEICDNGIDDDGDGFIDLNDADCQCHGIGTGDVYELSSIPNPSFEEKLCCPYEPPNNYPLMDCVESWLQASALATPDYFNTCETTHGVLEAPPPFPLPAGGAGYVGLLDNIGYSEYVGVCLRNPIYAGTKGQLNLYLSRGRGTETTYVVSFYGTPDCNDLPWNGKLCPIGQGSWVLLGTDTVSFPLQSLPDSSWQRASISFHVEQHINGIAVGGPCGGQPSDFPSRYMYMDELSLDSIAYSNYNIHVQETGKWCTNNLALEASINTSGGIWQWYRDGIALVGETSTSLDLMLYSVENLYTAVYSLNGECASIDYMVDTTDPANFPRALNILNKDTIVCEGAIIPIVASATSGYNYQWLPTAGVSDPHSLTPDITVVRNSVSYSLTASYPGCPDTSQSFYIEVDSQYVATFYPNPKEICVGQPVYLYPQVDGSVKKLLWEFPDHDRPANRYSEFQHAFEEEGSYPVTLYSQFRACPDTSYTDSVIVYPLPEVDLGSDSSICLHGAPVYLKNLRETSLYSYRNLWNTGDTIEVLKVVQPGIYSLSIMTEPIGCTTTESVEVTKGCYIDIPNAFTPNGDGHNDYFFPRQLLSENVSRFKMQVFNRWGQIIFETTNIEGRGWDGRLNDRMQPMDVYVYKIEVDFGMDGRREQYEGNVTLIR